MAQLAGIVKSWPQVDAVYRNGASFTVYTTLGPRDFGRGIDVCNTVVEDVVPEAAAIAAGNPYILVLSRGGPATSVELADGSTIGTSCTSLGP